LTVTPHLITKHLIEALLLDSNFKNAFIDAYKMKNAEPATEIELSRRYNWTMATAVSAH
jgi:hypothetical protein